MSRLDEPGTYSIDRSGMLRHVVDFGTQLEASWRTWHDLGLPAGVGGGRRTLVIAGMGGSGSGGDYVEALCRDISTSTVQVVRGFHLPEYVGPETLVVILSYSGETEEMLSCYADGQRRGARIAVGTGGGSLARLATADGVPIFKIEYDAPPRAALPHFLGLLLRVAQAETPDGGFVDDSLVTSAADSHRRLIANAVGPDVPTARNPAKQLAAAIANTRPILVAAEHLIPVATRFKNQLAENSKQIATSESLPEAAHNLVVGLCIEGASNERPLDLVTIESNNYDTRTQHLFERTVRLCEDAGCRVHRVRLEGGTLLGDLVAGTAWADLTSCYAALLRGIDPTPIPAIEALKGTAALR